MSWIDILITLSAALVSGLLGVIISTCYYRKYERRKIKYEILRNIIGYRYVLTSNILNDPDYSDAKMIFMSSLNQIFLVFNNDINVINALKEYNNKKSNDTLITLIKEISKSLKIDISKVNDSFIEIPFVTTHNR